MFVTWIVLASMDLPPDKARLLRAYDDEKKWEMIKDQDKVTAKESPEFYLKRLRTYLDPKASRSSKKRRLLGDSTSTQVLRELEISLRTNSIDWVREFLSQENKGLDVLIDYLTFRLVTQQHQQKILEQQRIQQKKIEENGSLSNGTHDDNTDRLNGDVTSHSGVDTTTNNGSAGLSSPTHPSAISVFRENATNLLRYVSKA